jgi:17beta-estradiol 17-dehydrogenase / very-long-chain 3-oxoacyl-CoA reductase
VLVSRSESKLKLVAHEIDSKYAAMGVQTKLLALDFSRSSEQDYARLKALLDGMDVAILVNNVGQSHAMPVPFILTPKHEMTDIVAVNCLATLRVTQLVAPGMAQRGRGLILTIGSFAGLVPTPLLATYSGSKAFLQHWSSALGAELRPHGVDVQLVLSYLVVSAMSKIRRPSMLIPTARTFARAVVGKIGRSGGAQGIAFTSTPYWSHALMHWALATFSGTMNLLVVDRNRIAHEQIRKRALRKLEKDSKKAT